MDEQRPAAGGRHDTDVIVVGAGPVGLFAVFECGMVRLRCHVVDALDDVGGQCVALYPEKPIYDIPGIPRIDAGDLIRNLVAQASPFDPVYHLGQSVARLERRDGGGWRATTSRGVVIDGGAVVIAGGVGAFGPNRPPLDGIEALEGTSVFYHVARREDFRGRRVVIAGGGDSAVDWALSLSEIAARVMVVHRRAKFRAAPESEARLKALATAGKLDLVVPYQLHGLDARGGTLRAVTVATLDGDTRRLEADALLPFFGLSTDLGPIASWGLARERDLIAVDAATCATNLPGVFAIGDIATYAGKLKLILCGFSEAAMAARAIRAALRPDEPLHFEYSTTSGVARLD